MTRRRRRNFTQMDLIAIVGRATDAAGKVHCERCGEWCRKRADYQIDHVIAEGSRPAADLARKLTPADGQLLCVALCHPVKTKRDKADIGRAKRLEAAELGVKPPPRRKVNWGHYKDEKPPLKTAPGKPRVAREYGL
jgi:hypothetical protein